MDRLETVKQEVAQGRRLSREDGLLLLEAPDILGIGRLARAAKQQRSGAQVFFNINCHVNLTNVCVSRCAFCAFSCDESSPRAYVLTADDVVRKVRAAAPEGITEVHMVSGLHPRLPFEHYVAIVRRLKCEFPRLHIKAFTPVEIQYFSDLSGLSTEAVLCALQAAGLGSLPGGGAEVLSSRVREQLCPRKATARQWLDIMRTAHALGLRSNATLLFGHIETAAEIIDHLLQVRALQDETGGFQAFVPLPFHPENTMIEQAEKPTACEMLKIVSISRLMLDNVDHVKAYWIMLGLKVAQLALLFGADDIDGTVTEEQITHAAGADTAPGLPRDELVRLIKQAGMIPVQRDTLYQVLETYA
jgi:aminodeoxyfutalosine synthase